MARAIQTLLVGLVVLALLLAVSATIMPQKHHRPRSPLRATHNLRNALADNKDIPGLNAGIARGIDVRTGDLRAPIVNFHYSYQNRWTNPYNSKTYLVPDELEISNTPGSYYEKTNHIIQNMTAYQELQKQWHSLSIGIPFIFAFQNNKETGVIKELLRNNDATVFMAETNFAFYEMQMWPHDLLEGQESSRLTKMIATLPSSRKTADEKSQYSRFINTFGTHYNSQSRFGGQVMFLIAVENSLFYSKSVEWVHHQVSLSFQISYLQFGFSSEHTKNDEKVDSQFTKHSKSVTIVKGGNDNTATHNSKEWFPTTIDNPAVIHPNLVELSALIKDPVKSGLLHDAIIEYLKKPEAALPGLSSSFKRMAEDTKYVPGVNSGIARGWDVVTENMRNPIVVYHYDYGQTWNNPYINNELESIPDELFLTNVPTNIIDGEINMMTTWQSYSHMEERTINAKIGLGLGEGISIDAAFSRSKKQVMEWLKNNTRNIGTENRIIALYQLEMWDDFELHPRLKSMIDQLPTTYNTNEEKQKYGNIISLFGTHYISSSMFGSFVNFTTVFESSLFNKHTAEWVSRQLSLSIEWSKIKIGIDTGKNSETDKVDHVFAQNSKSYKDSEGGNPIVLESKGYAEWIQTIPSNPSALRKYKCVMFPLHRLINNSAKKANMLKALQSYVKTGVLPGN